MRPISDKSDTPEHKDTRQLPVTSGESSADSQVPGSQDVNELRESKLARIRLAIESGDYDSDELMEKSLSRLLEKIENEKDSQNAEQ